MIQQIKTYDNPKALGEPVIKVKDFLKSIEKLETRLFGWVFDSEIKSLKQAEKEVYELLNKLKGNLK